MSRSQTISLSQLNEGITVIVTLVSPKTRPGASPWLTNALVVSMDAIEMHFASTSRLDSDACVMMAFKAMDLTVNLSTCVKHLHVIWVSCVVT